MSAELMRDIVAGFARSDLQPLLDALHDDVVWGCFDVALSYDAKGKGIEPVPVAFEVAIRWRMKDGKIIEHQAFFDTAHLLMKQKEAQA